MPSSPCVSCRSPSGDWDIVVASKGFWGSSSFFLRCTEDGGTDLTAKPFTRGTFIFADESPGSFFSDSEICEHWFEQ